jgi:hypothetical protein
VARGASQPRLSQCARPFARCARSIGARRHFTGDDFGYSSRFYKYPLVQWPRLFVECWAGKIWGFMPRELRAMPALTFMVDAR